MMLPKDPKADTRATRDINEQKTVAEPEEMALIKVEPPGAYPAAISEAELKGPQQESKSSRAVTSQKFVYTDYAVVEPMLVGRHSVNVVASSLRVQKLPSKLSSMLSNPEFSHIISWMPHGRAWKVHDVHMFVELVIPRFFEYKNYNSFIRLVNAWGFRRMLKGHDRHSYYHELFLREMPHLHSQMRRLTSDEKKAPMDPDDEPDFYRMGEVNPTHSTRGDTVAQSLLSARARNPLLGQSLGNPLNIWMGSTIDERLATLSPSPAFLLLGNVLVRAPDAANLLKGQGLFGLDHLHPSLGGGLEGTNLASSTGLDQNTLSLLLGPGRAHPSASLSSLDLHVSRAANLTHEQPGLGATLFGEASVGQIQERDVPLRLATQLGVGQGNHTVPPTLRTLTSQLLSSDALSSPLEVLALQQRMDSAAASIQSAESLLSRPLVGSYVQGELQEDQDADQGLEQGQGQ